MRVMMTRCVAEAWEIFCRQKKHVVIRSFRCLRIPLSIDGSCDEEISIKGLETLSLITALKKWRTQGAPACEDDESEETGSNSSGHEEELEMLSNSLATSDSLTRSSPLNPIPPQGERACTRRGRGGRARGAIHSTRGKKQQANLPSVSDGNMSSSVDDSAHLRTHASRRGRSRTVSGGRRQRTCGSSMPDSSLSSAPDNSLSSDPDNSLFNAPNTPSPALPTTPSPALPTTPSPALLTIPSPTLLTTLSPALPATRSRQQQHQGLEEAPE